MTTWVRLTVAARRAWLGGLGIVGDLVFPGECAGCRAPLAVERVRQEPWCRSCSERLIGQVSASYCHRCGLTVGPHLADAAGCPTCRGRRWPLEGLVRVGSYGGFAGELVRRFKFGRQQRLDTPLGMLLAAAIEGEPWRDDLDGLVPVPVSWRSRLVYQGDPPRLLANQVRAVLDPTVIVLPIVTLRGKKRRQVGLEPAERARNVQGVFRLRRGADVRGATLCIIDDVSTTGATLAEVGRLLKQAGADRVYAAVVARTQPVEARMLGA